jgi:hypothetical protein
LLSVTARRWVPEDCWSKASDEEFTRNFTVVSDLSQWQLYHYLEATKRIGQQNMSISLRVVVVGAQGLDRATIGFSRRKMKYTARTLDCGGHHRCVPPSQAHSMVELSWRRNP